MRTHGGRSSAPRRCGMNRGWARRLLVLLANLAWFLSCLPGLMAFVLASFNVRRTQTRLLFRTIRRNANTEWGLRLRFAAVESLRQYRSVPLSEYEDYVPAVARIRSGERNVTTNAPVETLLPTSGSTGGTKWIPFTPSLGREFRAAVTPWIGSMFLAHPSALAGRHYWAISPTTPCVQEPGAAVRIGFADDAEYLGAVQRRLARVLFAVPAEVSQAPDGQTCEYLTLLFLLREKNLRVISVWHASFLTLLVNRIGPCLPAIVRDIDNGSIDSALNLPAALRSGLERLLKPAPARARELEAVDTSRRDFAQCIWPSMRIISCWTEGRAQPWLGELAERFPRAAIQGKGLTATEGIVSFPFGSRGRKVCAIRSHFIEFADPETGRISHAWEVREGAAYTVILTTGGGLYRYRMHDLVRVTGWFNRAPCLEFIARDNLISDLVGEKLDVRHVEECIHAVEKSLRRAFSFALVAPAPVDDEPGYILYAHLPQATPADYAAAAASVETMLLDNYHYRHARALSQLHPLRVSPVTGDAAAAYRDALVRKGMKAGDIKFEALSRDAAVLSETQMKTATPFCARGSVPPEEANQDGAISTPPRTYSESVAQ